MPFVDCMKYFRCQAVVGYTLRITLLRTNGTHDVCCRYCRGSLMFVSLFAIELMKFVSAYSIDCRH